MDNNIRIENYIMNNMTEDICIVDDTGRYSYLQMKNEIYAVQKIIRSYGMMPGDKIIILSPNGKNAIVSIFATLNINCVAAPVDIQTPMELVVDMIDIIDARMIIYSGDDVKISELREKCNNIVFLKIEDTNCNDDIEFVNQSDLILSKTSSDPAVILFTSGTTGKMKAVVHSHENIIVNVNAVDDYMNINKNDIFYVLKTYVHCSSLISEIFLAFSKGASVCLYKPKVSLSTIIRRIKNEKATILGINPTFLSLMSQLNKMSDGLNSVRLVATSGAVLDENLVASSREVFRNAIIINVYGLTEAGPRISAERPNGEYKCGSVGKPIKGVEVKIDIEQSGADSIGEIIVKSKSIMLGYYNDDVSTKAKIQDGWLRTGDLGYIDEEGYLFVIGRKDEMIIRGSHNVAPARVESVINKIEGVLTNVVFGVDDKINGQNVVCAIIAESKIDTSVIIEECKKHLYEYECPQNIVFWDSIPKTIGGKISRKLASEKYVSRIL